jgi:hypothetical protein
MLDRDLLSTYEERLRAQGVPVDGWTRPGLTTDEMRETLSPLGLRLPIEGSVWWAWRDGGEREGREHVLGPYKDFLSLSEAVKRHQDFRAIAEEQVEPDFPPFDDPDYQWNPAWLPISGDPSHPVVIDCSVAEGMPTPLRVIDWEDIDGFFKPRAESLGQLVSWYMKAMDAGAWRWSPERRQWDVRRELLDDELRMTPLL